jgi:pyruvate,water dikinase
MYVFSIEHTSSNMVRSVGRKSAYLGELARSGIRVPWGFVVTRAAFRRFMELVRGEINEILRGVNLDDPADVRRRYETVKDLIASKEMPLDIHLELEQGLRTITSNFVAVRPTITSPMSGPSFAGELDTYLFVEKGEIEHYTKMAWASYFNPRALAYRLASGNVAEIAVLVQEMVEPDSAGTAFTIHPVTKDPNVVVIESSWGLGQAVTKGLVTPDTFVLPKRDRVVKEKIIGHKHLMLKYDPKSKSVVEVPLGGKAMEPSLDNVKAVELANLAIRIEELFGRHVNLEWALSSNKLYILEVRGVRTTWEDL